MYLPRDVRLALTASAARTALDGQGVQWEPAGGARLSFPLLRHLRPEVGWSAGTEDYASVDQIGHIAARTFSAGVRYEMSARRSLWLSVAQQQRSQGRTQTTVGAGYAIRF